MNIDTFTDLTFTDLNSSSRGDATAGNGGAVSIFMEGGEMNGGSIVASSLANGSAGNGGNVLIEDGSVSTNLTLNTIDTSSRSAGGAGTVGNGGSVNIGASNTDLQQINLSNIDTSVTSANGSGGTAGSVKLATDANSIITVGTILANSGVATANGTANGGQVVLQSFNNTISVTGGIDTSATAGNGGAISLISTNSMSLGNSTLDSSGSQNGGAIEISSEIDAVSFGGTINSTGSNNDGAVTFAAEELIFTGATGSINRGNAQATLQTGTNGIPTPIIVGSASAPSATDLVLDNTVFDTFAASTGLMNIGKAGRTPAITGESDFTKTSPVAFRQPTVVNFVTNVLGLEFHDTATVFTLLSVGTTTFFSDGQINNSGSGSGDVIKDGTGTLTINAPQNYSGFTIVRNGVIDVVGSLANNGSDKIFIAPDADGNFATAGPTLIRATGLTSSYAGFGSQIEGGLGTQADILFGTNATGTDSTVTMQWRTEDVSETLISDVLNLTGMENSLGLSETDTFVLQMSYEDLFPAGVEATAAADGDLYLAWLNGPLWVNAVEGNSNFAGSLGSPFLGSWAAAGSPTALGEWGVDIVSNQAWAVLNHNSQFSVVPEPSSFVLMALGGLGLWLFRRQRNRVV